MACAFSYLWKEAPWLTGANQSASLQQRGLQTAAVWLAFPTGLCGALILSKSSGHSWSKLSSCSHRLLWGTTPGTWQGTRIPLPSFWRAGLWHTVTNSNCHNTLVVCMVETNCWFFADTEKNLVPRLFLTPIPAPCALLSLLSYTTQEHLSRGGPAHSKLGLPHQSLIQTMTHRCLPGQPGRGISPIESISSKMTRGLCRVDNDQQLHLVSKTRMYLFQVAFGS